VTLNFIGYTTDYTIAAGKNLALCEKINCFFTTVPFSYHLLVA